MSAFIVSHRTIDSILSEVSNDTLRTYDKTHIENILFEDILNAPRGYNLSCDSLKTYIGRELLRQNTVSVNSRYPDNPQSMDYAESYSFKKTGLGYFQAIKSLECLEYQSSEAKDWEDSKAFTLCRKLQGLITASQPEYDNAAWGL